MAQSSARTRLFTELSRNRTSSPHDEEFATAGSFDIENDAVIHSTQQMGVNTTQQQLPTRYVQEQEYAPTDDGSEGSADMSIELGRGVKRGAHHEHEDMSSNLVFNVGQYEVTSTPPPRIRNGSRKGDDMLRRESSIRRAREATKGSEAVQRTVNGTKHRTLSETLEDQIQPTETIAARNTRFVRTRQASTNELSRPTRSVSARAINETFRRMDVNPATTQSATYTANSFILPDLPNLTELVSGTRKDGTPVFNRSIKSRSRFTSANYKPLRPEHVPVESVPIPEEEKAIFASLQLLKDKVADLEMEKSEAEKRTEEHEGEIINLRSQLQAQGRRPDSALGSDEEGSASDKWHVERTKLQASVKALQHRVDRSERKISVSEIAVKHVTKERDELITQIGVAYFNNEELKAANETFRDRCAKLETEDEALRDEVEALRNENQQLRLQLGLTHPQNGGEKQQRRFTDNGLVNELGKRDNYFNGIPQETWNTKHRSAKNQGSTSRGKKEGDASRCNQHSAKRQTTDCVQEAVPEDIASRIAREVQMQRERAAMSKSRQNSRGQERESPPLPARSRSKSQHRQQTITMERRTAVAKPNATAPVDSEASDGEISGESEGTRKTKNAPRSRKAPFPAGAMPREHDTRDITLLSHFDTNVMADLRRKIEEEYRSNRLKQNASISAQTQDDATAHPGQPVTHGVPRKSSFKDMAAGVENGTSGLNIHGGIADEIAKAAKTVRVQSPHTSDASGLPQQNNPNAETADLSILSNTSRRRRRAISTEGITSAFIIPDITLHNSETGLGINGKCCVHHNADSCTVCHPQANGISIPDPVPVTDREIVQDTDITSATIRPAQPPPVALATVIKQIEDEITHLKLQLEAQQRLYSQHNPALSKRRRVMIKSRIDAITAKVERRSDQVYALYDVLEGQKEAAAQAATRGEKARDLESEEIEETLMSIGIDPAELSGRIGRTAPANLDGADDMSDVDSEELAWEGLSDYESEDGGFRSGEKRRSAAF